MTVREQTTTGADALMRQSQTGAEAHSLNVALARKMRRRGEESRWWWIVPTVYIIVLLLPIYWLINMSFKTNAEIVSSLTLYPHQPTIANYVTIFTDASW